MGNEEGYLYEALDLQDKEEAGRTRVRLDKCTHAWVLKILCRKGDGTTEVVLSRVYLTG